MGKKSKLKKVSSKKSSRLQIPLQLPINYDEKKPIFSFIYMKYGSKNCLSQCDQNLKSLFAEKLLMLSQNTWKKIASIPKEGLGYEKIPIHQFKIPLLTVTPDVRSLMVFRFSGGERMAGIRENDIYHIYVIGKELYDH